MEFLMLLYYQETMKGGRGGLDILSCGLPGRMKHHMRTSSMVQTALLILRKREEMTAFLL